MEIVMLKFTPQVYNEEEKTRYNELEREKPGRVLI